MAKEVVNPVDVKFNIDMDDPWQGTKPDFGYVPLKDAKDPAAEGFYWLWPCLTNPNAPIMVEYIGGPGMCSLGKGWTTRCPLGIDSKNNCLIKHENPLTDHWNMLFIDSPIGSGYSITKILPT